MKRIIIAICIIMTMFCLCSCSATEEELGFIEHTGIGKSEKTKIEIVGTWLSEDLSGFEFKKKGVFSKIGKNGLREDGTYHVLDGKKLILDYTDSAESATYYYDIDGNALTLENYSTGYKKTYYGDKETHEAMSTDLGVQSLLQKTQMYMESLENCESEEERIKIISQYENLIPQWKESLVGIDDSNSSKSEIEDNIWDLEWEAEHKY